MLHLLVCVVGFCSVYSSFLDFEFWDFETICVPASWILTMGGRTARYARAVRTGGCFSPPVATGPRVLNSAPYSLCWYTRDFLF